MGLSPIPCRGSRHSKRRVPLSTFAGEQKSRSTWRHKSRLGPDRNSGSGTGSGGIRAGTGRFGRYQTMTSTAIFFILYYRLDHVNPSSSQTVSRATIQFPDCITCSPPVRWLYHVLPSSSQTVSRATFEFIFTVCYLY